MRQFFRLYLLSVVLVTGCHHCETNRSTPARSSVGDTASATSQRGASPGQSDAVPRPAMTEAGDAGAANAPAFTQARGPYSDLGAFCTEYQARKSPRNEATKKRDGYCRPGTKVPGNYPRRIRAASLIDTQEGSGGMLGLGSTGVAFDTNEGTWVAPASLVMGEAIKSKGRFVHTEVTSTTDAVLFRVLVSDLAETSDGYDGDPPPMKYVARETASVCTIPASGAPACSTILLTGRGATLEGAPIKVAPAWRYRLSTRLEPGRLVIAAETGAPWDTDTSQEASIDGLLLAPGIFPIR